MVHKPPGVPFHATDDERGLLQLVRAQQGQPHLPYEGPLWPVHRLDRLTSGALVLATNRAAAGELVAAFRQRDVQKFYVALSDRKPSKKMGSVVGDMEVRWRDAKRRLLWGGWERKSAGWCRRRAAQPMCARVRTTHTLRFHHLFPTAPAERAARQLDAASINVRPCRHALHVGGGARAAGHTRVAAETRDGAHAPGTLAGGERQMLARMPGAVPALSLLRPCLPSPLLTLQLRVAMKSLGAPVLGDERYAQAAAAAERDRGYLHAAALRFRLQGGAVQVVCRPCHGEEFLTAGFRQLFDAWLPQDLVADEGPWLPDSRLLRSELPPS